MAKKISDFVSEFIGGQINLPEPLQREAAGIVAHAFQSALLSLPPEQRPADPMAFWQDPNNALARTLRKQVLQGEVPSELKNIQLNQYPTAFTNQKNQAIPIDQEYQRKIQEGVDALKSATSIQELQNVVARSMFPAIRAYTAQEAKNNLSVAVVEETVSRAFQAVVEVMPGYDPSGAPFYHYATKKGILAFDVNANRAEAEQRPAGTLSIEASMGRTREGELDAENTWDISSVLGADPVAYLVADPKEKARLRAINALPDLVPAPLFSRTQPSVQIGGVSYPITPTQQAAGVGIVKGALSTDAYYGQFVQLPLWGQAAKVKSGQTFGPMDEYVLPRLTSGPAPFINMTPYGSSMVTNKMTMNQEIAAYNRTNQLREMWAGVRNTGARPLTYANKWSWGAPDRFAPLTNAGPGRPPMTGVPVNTQYASVGLGANGPIDVTATIPANNRGEVSQIAFTLDQIRQLADPNYPVQGETDLRTVYAGTSQLTMLKKAAKHIVNMQLGGGHSGASEQGGLMEFDAATAADPNSFTNKFQPWPETLTPSEYAYARGSGQRHIPGGYTSEYVDAFYKDLAVEEPPYQPIIEEMQFATSEVDAMIGLYGAQPTIDQVRAFRKQNPLQMMANPVTMNAIPKTSVEVIMGYQYQEPGDVDDLRQASGPSRGPSTQDAGMRARMMRALGVPLTNSTNLPFTPVGYNSVWGGYYNNGEGARYPELWSSRNLNPTANNPLALRLNRTRMPYNPISYTNQGEVVPDAFDTVPMPTVSDSKPLTQYQKLLKKEYHAMLRQNTHRLRAEFGQEMERGHVPVVFTGDEESYGFLTEAASEDFSQIELLNAIGALQVHSNEPGLIQRIAVAQIPVTGGTGGTNAAMRSSSSRGWAWERATTSAGQKAYSNYARRQMVTDQAKRLMIEQGLDLPAAMKKATVLVDKIAGHTNVASAPQVSTSKAPAVVRAGGLPPTAKAQTQTQTLVQGQSKWHAEQIARSTLASLPDKVKGLQWAGKGIPMRPGAMASYDKNKDAIYLADRFGDDAFFQSDEAKAAYGDVSPDEMRAEIIAHEWGHKMSSPVLRQAAQEWLDNLPADKRAQLTQRISEKAPSYLTNGELGEKAAEEVAASVMASTQVKGTSHILTSRWGMEEDELAKLAHIGEAERKAGRVKATSGMETPFDVEPWDPGDPGDSFSYGGFDPESFEEGPFLSPEEFASLSSTAPRGARALKARKKAFSRARAALNGMPANNSSQIARRAANAQLAQNNANALQPTVSPAPAAAQAGSGAAAALPGGGGRLGAQAQGLRNGPFTARVGAAMAAANNQQRTNGGWDVNRIAGVAQVGLQDAATLYGTSLGNPEIFGGRQNDPAEVSFTTTDGVSDTGEINSRTTLGSANVQFGVNATNAAFQKAVGEGNLPSNTNDMMATLNRRVGSYVKETVNKYIKGLEDAVSTPEQGLAVRETAQRMGVLTKELTNQVMTNVQAAIQSAGGETGDWRKTGYNAISMNKEQLIQGAAASPMIYDAVQRAGGINAALSGPMQVVSNENGTPFAFGQGSGARGSWGGGGGGGGGGGSRGGPPGIWGSAGGIGRAFYGAYLAKRLWGMTGGPVTAESKQYEQYLGEFQTPALAEASMSGTSLSLGDTMAGGAMRAAKVTRWRERGAYEQYGGMTDAMYSLTGASSSGFSLSRWGAGMQLAGGIAGAGMMAPMMMPGAMGEAIAGAAPWAAGAAASVVTAAEIANMIPKGNASPISLGGAIRQVTGDLYRGVAESRFVAGKLGAGAGIKQWLANSFQYFGAKGLYVPESIGRQYMTEEQGDIAYYKGETPESKTVLDLASAVNSATGEDITAIQPTIRSMQRIFGSLKGQENWVKQFAKNAAAASFSMGESLQEGSQIADQMGFRPSDPGFGAIVKTFNEATGPDGQAKRDRMSLQGERASRYGGMLGGYFLGGTKAGEQFASQMGISTQAEGQGFASQFQGLAEWGVNADSRMMGPNGGQTWGQFVNRAGQSMTLQQKQFAGQIMGSLAQYGGSPVAAAVGAYGLGVRNQAQYGAVMGNLNMFDMYGGGTQGQALQMMGNAMQMNPYQAGVAGGIANRMYLSGGYRSIVQASNAVSGLGITDAQMSMLDRKMSGDLGAWSWDSYKTGDMAGRFLDTSQQPIYTSDMRSFIGMLQGQATRYGNTAAQKALTEAGMGRMNFVPNIPGGSAYQGFNYQLAGTQDYRSQVAALTGATGEDLDAWASGGARARTLLHNERQAGYQMASAGVQLAGIALTERMLWGGGSNWQKPAAGSIWDIQNRQQKLQYQSQMADFAYQGKTMEVSNQFAIQQEGIQFQRMAANQDWQRWSMGFQRQQAVQSRGWQQQDWQYQDTTRQLSFDWSMEDINTQIRYASGRERTQLVKQRGRMATTKGLEDEQIDTQRSRQEQLWAQEDEQFRKQQQYSETLMALDKKQYDLSKTQRETMYNMEKAELARQMAEFQKSWKLQQEMQKKEREYQYEQLQLQKLAAGIQAAAAKESAEYAKQMDKVANIYDRTEGEFKSMVENDPTRIFKAATNMFQFAAKVNGDTMGSLSTAMYQLSRLTDQPGKVEDLISAINGVSSGKISQLIELLKMLK